MVRTLLDLKKTSNCGIQKILTSIVALFWPNDTPVSDLHPREDFLILSPVHDGFFILVSGCNVLGASMAS